jgi:aminoglycoside phosphotransferase (APT) family kinase protein
VPKQQLNGRAGIDAALVRRLVAAQFPQWRGLGVTPVEVDGWDNRTYRLGDDMLVRLPTREWYASAIEKEDRWLPMVARSLPVPIPVPLAKGVPGEGYPFAWSVRRWLDGEPARQDCVADMCEFAAAVADFLLALQRVDPTDGPPSGAQSFYRGCDLVHYDAQTLRSLELVSARIDACRASAVWQAARNAAWAGPPVWFHGDMASGNLLVTDGRLAALIDFGQCGVGDPACDLVIAWTFFSGESREVFRRAVGQDDATWARARGWALWKALINLAGDGADERAAADNTRVIEDVVTEHHAIQ